MGGDQTDNSAASAGAVYVFAHDGSGWAQQAYVKASNTASYNYFPGSLALSSDGSTLAVGTGYEYGKAKGVGGDQTDLVGAAGAVYVFTHSGPIWAQQAYVKASNTDTSDYFGSSVDLSADGSTLAVGAHGESSGATGVGGDQTDNTKLQSGAVYLY